MFVLPGISNPCDPNPCYHGGVCELTYYPPKPYVCTCPDPYTGTVCTGKICKK